MTSREKVRACVGHLKRKSVPAVTGVATSFVSVIIAEEKLNFPPDTYSSNRPSYDIKQNNKQQNNKQ